MSYSGFFAVGIGAALGAWLRWSLSVAFNHVLPSLPLGTLASNLVGGYLIGAAVALFEQYAGLAPELRLFVVTGFLGGLTTFSTFSAESVSLMQSGRYDLMLLHTVSHLAGSILLTVCGMLTIRAMVH